MANPTLAAEQCWSSVYACLIRVAELDASGVPNPGSDTLFRTDGVTEIRFSENVAEGDIFDQQNGCGDQCVVVQAPDRLQGIDLSMELCTTEASLFAALTGNPTMSAGGTVVGQQARLITDAPPNRVSVEAWARAWDGNEQAQDDLGALVYWHWHFPSTTWRRGEVRLENGVARIPFTGKGQQNQQYFDGPGNDAPEDINGMWAYHLDTELPSGACGPQALAAS